MPASLDKMSSFDILARPWAIAIHDAGAANMLIAWAAAATNPPDRVWADGPAKALWTARFGADAFVEGPEKLLDEAASLVSGTGWASDLEHTARIAASKRGVHSVAVIDHWVNYIPRFERDGRQQLPDSIWVGDSYALQIAKGTFPDIPVEVMPNIYLAEQSSNAGKPPENGDILFVAEPARSFWGEDLPGEFQALDHFASRRSTAGIPETVSMRLRPHPSDPPGKYDDWLSAHDWATLDRSPDMAAALQPARWVAGMNSVALVIALEAGREVICALPPNAPPCTLPHEGIARI